jgi:hypothetical protein
VSDLWAQWLFFLIILTVLVAVEIRVLAEVLR